MKMKTTEMVKILAKTAELTKCRQILMRKLRIRNHQPRSKIKSLVEYLE